MSTRKDRLDRLDVTHRTDYLKLTKYFPRPLIPVSLTPPPPSSFLPTQRKTNNIVVFGRF